MCGLFKAPKPAAVAPPAPPAPPAPEPPRAPAFNEDRRLRDTEAEGASQKRRGRSQLRIELQVPSGDGRGLRVPNK